MNTSASDNVAERTGSADAAARLVLQVVERKVESDAVISLTLADPSGRQLPEWDPGAHIDIHIGGRVRQYSLCPASRDGTTWRVGILREPNGRGGSKLIHEQMKPGVTAVVSLPRNNFVLHLSKKYIFVAGGIGITPILSMIGAAEREGATWSLVYAGRTGGSMAFVEDLRRYEDLVRLVPEDTAGRVDLTAFFSDIQGETLIYACGPEPLLVALDKATAHWPPGTLRTERFAAQEVDETGNEDFEVEFVDSGITATIPANKTILEVAEELDIPTFSSCGEGTCGTCETRVISGLVQHRDFILTNKEKECNNTMFICVSRSQGGNPIKLAL